MWSRKSIGGDSFVHVVSGGDSKKFRFPNACESNVHSMTTRLGSGPSPEVVLDTCLTSELKAKVVLEACARETAW